jgi:hypothetical protein
LILNLLGANANNKRWEKWTKLNVSVHLFHQGRIAQLQQEKEEILKEFGKTQKLPMHEMKV